MTSSRLHPTGTHILKIYQVNYSFNQVQIFCTSINSRVGKTKPIGWRLKFNSPYYKRNYRALGYQEFELTESKSKSIEGRYLVVEISPSSLAPSKFVDISSLYKSFNNLEDAEGYILTITNKSFGA